MVMVTVTVKIKRREKMNMHFKNHLAILTNFGNIKILDFADPVSKDYSIRFLFDEDVYKLHISGDLGDLTATNDSNMVYNRFSDFVDNPRYFEEKIDCMSRKATIFDEKTARKELKGYIADHPDYVKCYLHNDVKGFIDDVMTDFSEETGISYHGINVMDDSIPGISEYAGTLGEKSTGIIEIYLEAFKLAQKQLAEKERKH